MNSQALKIAPKKIPPAKPKDVERWAYENQYRAGRENSSQSLRRLLLVDSEQHFETRLSELCAGATALEIGCGDGRHSILAARSGAAHLTATDVALEALKLGSRNAERAGVANSIDFLEADAENLRFNDHCFDLIIEHEVFSSIDLNKVLPELHRVLKPGGRILGKECLGHNFLFNLNRHLKALFGKRTKWAVNHITRMEDFVLARRLFADVKIDYYHFVVLFGAPLVLLPDCALKRGAIEFLTVIDRLLFRIPKLQKYAFKAVFELSDPKGK